MSPDLNLRARARLGTTLRGKYRLESVLGVGGMAIVYKGVHRNRAEFAVKMLLPELSIDEELRARFLREGYAANSVKHPGVVMVVDDDVAEDGSAFVVMELLDGSSVEDLAAKHGGRLPANIASSIGCQVLDIIACAHDKGVLHRDLKPANLFATTPGLVKVLDFGIARVRDLAASGARATQSGVSFGTPAFMPPEQARGKTKEVDERSDVWAIGATLFTLITGSLVHAGENSAEVMVKAATEPARRVRSLAPETPPEIAAVIDRALAFATRDRWPSAAQMRDALIAAHTQSFGAPPAHAEIAAFVASAPMVSVHTDESTTRKAAVPYGEPIGATTAAPVETEKKNHAAKRNRSVLVAALSAGGVFVVGALFIALHGRGTPTSTMSSAATATATAAAASSAKLAPPPPSTVTPTATASEYVITPEDLPIDKPHPAIAATVKHATPSASAKPSCNPNYTIDKNGEKHFKEECFAK